MHRSLNQHQWEKCFQLIDPKLRAEGRVSFPAYAEGLHEFMQAFGAVRPWHVRINLYLDGSKNKRDPRPFAYVYVIWQDAEHDFHMFRDRWVKADGRWYTRVVGLVPNRPASSQDPVSAKR